MSSEADPGGNRSFDETDVRILRLLEANGRASYEEIARHVHLSANAVRGRVQALTRRRVIRGIHADIDWDGGGPKIEALIDIRLRAGAHHYAFERAAVALPERLQSSTSPAQSTTNFVPPSRRWTPWTSSSAGFKKSSKPKRTRRSSPARCDHAEDGILSVEVYPEKRGVAVHRPAVVRALPGQLMVGR